MHQGLPDPHFWLLCQLGLIQGITEDKDIIDTDAYKKKWNQLVHACRFMIPVEAESKACNVGDVHGGKTDDRDYKSTVNRAATSQEENTVEGNESDCNLYQLQIPLQVTLEFFIYPRLREMINRKQLRFVIESLNKCIHFLIYFVEPIIFFILVYSHDFFVKALVT